MQVYTESIPENAQAIVIFVHGFGVQWDSRGMFSDIAAGLPPQFGTILFDLYKTEGQDVYVTSVAAQVVRVQQIVNDITDRFPDTKIHLIAHSKGCIVTSLAQIAVNGKILFLAPPEIFGTRLQTYFERYPGATKTDTEFIIPRKDGTITHIPIDYFKQSMAIDAEGVMAGLAKTQRIVLIRTLADEVIGETTYKRLRENTNIEIQDLEADHNFTGETREALMHSIRALIV